MSSTTAIVSLVGLQRFTLFTNLPPDIRFIIWRLNLSPRVVEILASDICTGFYSQAVEIHKLTLNISSVLFCSKNSSSILNSL